MSAVEVIESASYLETAFPGHGSDRIFHAFMAGSSYTKAKEFNHSPRVSALTLLEGSRMIQVVGLLLEKHVLYCFDLGGVHL